MSESPEESGVFFVSEEEAGTRLDKILAARLTPAGSRTYFQYLIDEGKVLLNGAPVKKRIKPKAGDEVEVEYILTEELKLIAENIPLNIIYEDEWIIVVDKPSGMVVHPATGHWTGTFINALLYHCKTPYLHEENTLRPGIVHRLDKETSGLIVAAKTGLAQAKLIEMFAERRVHKKYYAVCIGNPGSGSIDAPIGRHPENRKKMAVLKEGGKPALTHYRSLKHTDTLSLVDIVIETGRTHQIRVHMKHLKTPVLGDATYGNVSLNEKLNIDRQMLHAYCLQFNHPITNVPMNFEAPLPHDMNKIIKKL